MSGSGIDYSLLYGGAGTTAADTISYLVAGLGGGSGALFAAGGDPLQALAAAERNQSADIAATAGEPRVQRTVAAFTAAVTAAKSPTALLDSPAALEVLLTVNGLGDQAAYPALARQALLSNPNDPNGLASRLAASNANWKAAASTYQFATKGLAVLRDPATLANIARSYAEVSWRQSLDQTTPGLSNALDFRARAHTATSADAILGDATFRTVVSNALGIPQQIAFQSLAAQEQAINTHLDIKRLQDPSFVDGIVHSYLLNTRSDTGGTAGGGGSLDALTVRASGLLV